MIIFIITRVLMRIVLFLLFFIISVVSITSCRSSFPRQDKEIVSMKQIHNFFGDYIVDGIIESDQIIYYTIAPQFPTDYQFQNSRAVNLDKDRLEIRRILLSDSSYVFGLTKRALFIPEFALDFVGEKKVKILFSPSSEQIEVLQEGNKSKKIDMDPTFNQIILVLKKYHTHRG